MFVECSLCWPANTFLSFWKRCETPDVPSDDDGHDKDDGHDCDDNEEDYDEGDDAECDDDDDDDDDCNEFP